MKIYIQKFSIVGNATYEFQVISDSFINRCLSVAEKINNTTVKSNSNPLDYLSDAFNSPFTNTKYKCTSTKEIKKFMKLLKQKIHMGMTIKILKISSPFMSLPLNHICNKSLSGMFPLS